MDIERLKETFAKAYEWRADASDIDWKPTRYKDKATGQWKEGQKLAYLSWAVAWRKFKEFYPDANYRLIETPEGSPLWNVNGYGMLKCAVSACDTEFVETFPVMTGGQNEAMPIDQIDCRDVNDSAQRGLTKAIARFGVGLYIFEGKLDAPTQVAKPQPKPQPTATKPQAKDDDPINTATAKYLDGLLAKHGVNGVQFQTTYGFDAYGSVGNAKKAKRMFDEIDKGEKK